MLSGRFCINFSGAWLDKGEIDKVLKLVQEKMVMKTLPELDKSALHQFAQYFGGPKGLVEDMKDFVVAWRMISLKFSITHPNLSGKIQAIRQSPPF